MSDLPLSDLPSSREALPDTPLSDTSLSDTSLSDTSLSDTSLSDMPLSDMPAGESWDDLPTAPSDRRETAPALNLLWLISRGGPLMLVIGLMSVAVIAIAIDRFIALRDARLIPSELINTLGDLSDRDGGLNPSFAYLACQDYPSPTSTVLRRDVF